MSDSNCDTISDYQWFNVIPYQMGAFDHKNCSPKLSKNLFYFKYHSKSRSVVLLKNRFKDKRYRKTMDSVNKFLKDNLNLKEQEINEYIEKKPNSNYCVFGCLHRLNYCLSSLVSDPPIVSPAESSAKHSFSCG